MYFSRWTTRLRRYLSPALFTPVRVAPPPVAGVETGTVGFLGETERGPTEPRLVRNFGEFERRFGGFDGYAPGGPLEGTYLAYAVEGFFHNGGSRCYVGRVTAETAVATATLAGTGSDDVLRVSASGPGEWGRRVTVTVRDGFAPNRFGLVVRYWADDADARAARDGDGSVPAPDVEEVFDDLPATGYEHMVQASALVTVEALGAERPAATTAPVPLTGSFPTSRPSVTTATFRGDDTPGARTGLAALAELDDIGLVCVPAQATRSDLADEVVAHCSALGDRVAILGAPADYDVTAPTTPLRSSRAALYVPWLDVHDPATGGSRLVPPVGHVAGVYGRTDATRGVHKPPANETVRGVLGLSTAIDDAAQDRLTPLGVNPIREFPTRGIRVWGARTLADDPQWRYVNVRRLADYLEESMTEWLRWAETEPNDDRTRERVREGLSNFLTTAWRDGALAGTTPDEAFFVRCDRSTTTRADIDAGRFVAEIGFAPTRPAEFHVLRLVGETGG